VNVPTPADEFLAAVYRIANHHVTQALNLQTPGVTWERMSKTKMAKEYEAARNNPTYMPTLSKVDLMRLAAQCKAREAGQANWHLAPAKE
jgi:hypothetical protein